jgi:hypothetical protein
VIRTKHFARVAIAGAALSAASAAQFAPSFELGAVDGSTGFRISGIGLADHSGSSISNAGDFNGDGIDDVIIGSPNASPGPYDYAGQAYVVFGKVGIGASGVVDLAALDGQNGVVLFMAKSHRHAGSQVAGAGDLNGDGFADVVVTDTYDAGAAYVVFGGVNVAPSGVVDLLSLDGTDGFKMWGLFSSANPDPSVSAAGDFNADGYADVIVGLPESNSKFLRETLEAGEACIVFGGPTVGAGGDIQLTALDGTNGVQIEGAGKYDACGTSVAGLGDFNGDGIDDVLVGAQWAAGSDGSAYVVFGGASAGVGGHIDVATLDPATSGMRLDGVVPSGKVGAFCAGPGDINADGLADLVLGAPYVDDPFVPDIGEVYVVFGGLDVGPDGALGLGELNGLNGFRVHGLDNSDFFGTGVAGAGDLNADGVADLVLGGPQGDPHGKSKAGESWVIFGHAAVGSAGTIDLTTLDGLSGFVVNGAFSGDLAGTSLAAGDLNGDGVDDLVVAAPWAWNGAIEGTGQTYCVFGKPSPPPVPSAPLIAFPDALKMLAPLPQKQVIAAGAEHAGRMYWMLGTKSGTAPGFVFDGISVPLNPDVYLDYTLAHPGGSLLPASVGVLDDEGRAVSWFLWPDGLVSLPLIGTELHHAFGVVDPTTAKLKLVSNAAPLVISL